jgi:hypothetical protein
MSQPTVVSDLTRKSLDLDKEACQGHTLKLIILHQ